MPRVRPREPGPIRSDFASCSHCGHADLTAPDEDAVMQRWRWIGSLLVTAVVLVAGGATTSASPTAPAASTASGSSCSGHGSVAHRNLRYARDPGVAARLQSLDLYVPKRADGCAPAPVVVWVHGGGFRRGDKANKVADKVRVFTRAGWAFASVNYRLVADAASGPTRGVYPAQQEDLAAALAYLRTHARDHGLSRHATMLLGHSAGAFLVALEATNLSFVRAAGVPAAGIRCTVALDTAGYDVGAEIAAGGLRERMFRSTFGDDPADWEAASPIRAAGTNRPLGDFLLFTRGRLDRYAGNVAFRDTLRNVGTHADVVRVNPLTHEQVNAAVGKRGDTLVTPPLMRFLRTCV
jgi:arylformamidase